jgi:predicted nucleic acid-binding protein
VELKYVLDTNILLYHLGGRLADPIPDGDLAISVISEMELLSFPGITPQEEHSVQQMIATLPVIELTPTIKAEAVRLRRAYNVKLPDAIIAATALNTNAVLISNDATFKKISTLQVHALITL